MIREVGFSNIIELGEHTYCVSQNRLCDAAGQEIFLRPQSAQVLQALVENAGLVVLKDRLIEKVWPHVSVTDDSLTQCIADIRRTIGDRERKIVQTVPKKGYVLAVPPLPVVADRTVPAGAAIDEAVFAFGALRPALVHVAADALPAAGDLPNGPEWQSYLAGLDHGPMSRAGGKIVGTSPQGALIGFPDVAGALRFAIWLGTEEGVFAPERPRGLRIGVDLLADSGAGAAHGHRSRATQLSSLARDRRIVVSVDVRDAACSEPDLDFEDLGEQPIHRGRDTVRAFGVHRRTLAGRFHPDLSGEDLLPTVAVIPFTPRDGPAENGVIGEMIADDIISSLSRSQEANVTSRLSTAVFKSGEAGLQEIGGALNADFVLSGSYSGNADRVVLTLELAEVRSNRVLWSDRLEIGVAALLRESDTVQEIVYKLRKSIVLSEIRRVRSTPLPDLKSYSLMIGAVGLMHRLLPPDFEVAGTLLRSLIERTPNQPAPLSWMARWHVLRVQQGWSNAPGQEADSALACSRRALEIDPENSLALTSEGFVLTNLLRRLDDAEERYNAAIEANPNDANGRLLRGTLYAFQGRGDEAKRDSERALHLAPLDPHRFFFLALAAGANLAAEDYERALTLAKASLRMNRAHTSTLRVKTVAHMCLGQEDAARETARELMRQQPGLQVGEWLRYSPSADFRIGKQIADALRAAGVPE